MKKILSGMTAFGLVTLTAVNVLACKSNNVASNDLNKSFKTSYEATAASSQDQAKYGLTQNGTNFNFISNNLDKTTIQKLVVPSLSGATITNQISNDNPTGTAKSGDLYAQYSADNQMNLTPQGSTKLITYNITLTLWKAETQSDKTIKWINQNISMTVQINLTTSATSKTDISNLIPKSLEIGTLNSNTVVDFNSSVKTKLNTIPQLNNMTLNDFDIYKVNSKTRFNDDDISKGSSSVDVKIEAKGDNFEGTVDGVTISFDKAVVTYTSIPDAIKALNIVSFSQIGTTNFNDVVRGILLDVFTGIIKQKYSPDVNFEENKFKFHQESIINMDTNQPLKVEDLNTEKNINLQLSADYDSTTNIIVGKSVLSVVNKSDQDVVSFLNNFNYRKILTSDILRQENILYYVNSKVEYLKTFDLERLSITVLGSFGLQYVDNSKFKLNTFTKEGRDLNDEDIKLPAMSKLSFKLNYDYGTITNQNLDITIILSKYDIRRLRWNDVDQTINLGAGQNPTNLTQDNVNTIIASLKTTILNEMNNVYTQNFSKLLTLDDVDITGFNEITVGSDFSNMKGVTYQIQAKDGSNAVTGTLSNKSINVIATSS